MGQKVNPIGFRVGVYRDWDAKWIPRTHKKGSYAKSLQEDLKIRSFLEKNLDYSAVSRILIEKTGCFFKILIYSSKPGSIIGKKGQGIDALRAAVSNFLKINSVEISIEEVKNPEMDAVLIANSIALQLEKRANFKKLMKRASTAVMPEYKTDANLVKGIKIRCKGRLNGAEIARSEWLRMGSVPLHKLRENIDYGFAVANTTYGTISVKVWLSKGEFKFSRNRSLRN